MPTQDRHLRSRRWWGTFAAVAVGALALALAASCVDLDSLGNGPPREAGLADAPDDALGAEDAEPVDPCRHSAPPEPPVIDDAPGEELAAFEAAIDVVTLDPDVVLGFDVDGVCTCDERPGTAADGGPTCASDSITCDADGGVDNAMAVVAKAASPLADLTLVPNRLVANGHRTLVFQLSKYNGRANDMEVVVGAFVVEGIHVKVCPSSTPSPVSGCWTPGRCGDDTWTVSADSTIKKSHGELLPLVVGTGYVRDFQLVARLGNPVTLPFTTSRDVTFAQATLTATIVPLGVDLAPRDPTRPPTADERRLFRLERGVLGGRVAAEELLAALGSYNPKGDAFCKSGTFEIVRSMICDARDIRRSPTSVPDYSQPCDGLSGAFGFTAVPARIAPPTDAGPAPDPCVGGDAAAFVCP